MRFEGMCESSLPLRSERRLRRPYGSGILARVSTGAMGVEDEQAFQVLKEEQMRSSEITRTEHGRQFVIVFEVGDEVVQHLRRWCNERQITAARLTGIGGFSTATVAWFDWEAHEFREVTVAEQVELLAISGDVAE